MRKLVTLAAALCLFAVAAPATDIHKIETEVYLHRNGNAVVGQWWDINITGGTEWYIPISNLGERYIRDFTVFENGVEYENDGRDWDSSRSLEAKTHRCGIIDKGSRGVELCWGQGAMGEHQYFILYIIEDLVTAMADGENDGFIWQFLNDEWTAKPDSACLRVYNMADSTRTWVAGEGGNMGAWVFGGEFDYGVQDGVLSIESTEPFRYESSLILMMRFDKGWFNPSVTDSRTFEELRARAFEGSDYFYPDDDDDEDWMEKVLIFLVKLFFYGFIFLIIIPIALYVLWMKTTGNRYKKKIFGKRKITGWWRDLPYGGDIVATFSLFNDGDNLSGKEKLFGNLTGAYFLRWLQKGLIVAEPDPTKADRVNLRFSSSSPDTLETSDNMEGTMWKAARQASGKNLILERDEFDMWSKIHWREVTEWPDTAVRQGKAVWEPTSEEERCHAVEFKNYLEDFTLSKERTVPEIGLWNDYLVFAQLFGIADKVSKSFEKLQPGLYQQYVQQTYNRDAVTSYMVLNSISRSSRSFVSKAYSRKSEVEASARSSARSRYSGGGGHSSWGGGGGFSGGGHGGGSR